MMRFRHPCRLTRPRSRRGFTLLEVMVVLGIMVVLLSLLLPVINRTRRRAQMIAQRQDLATISAAIYAFKSDLGYFPMQYAAGLTGGSCLGNFLLGVNPWRGDYGYRPEQDETGARRGRVYGPYLAPDRWRPYIITYGQLAQLVDRWEGPIWYYPRLTPNQANPQGVGGTASPPTPGAKGPFWDGYYQWQMGGLSHVEYTQDPGEREVIRFLLGDTNLNNWVDVTQGEQTVWEGPFLLISGGPDGLDNRKSFYGATMSWGYLSFRTNVSGSWVYKPSVTEAGAFSASKARMLINESDDIYNFYP